MTTRLNWPITILLFANLLLAAIRSLLFSLSDLATFERCGLSACTASSGESVCGWKPSSWFGNNRIPKATETLSEPTNQRSIKSKLREQLQKEKQRLLTSTKPFLNAASKGEAPLFPSISFTSAPFSTKSFTTSRWPPLQASHKAVLPIVFFSSIRAPLHIKKN